MNFDKKWFEENFGERLKRGERIKLRISFEGQEKISMLKEIRDMGITLDTHDFIIYNLIDGVKEVKE